MSAGEYEPTAIHPLATALGDDWRWLDEGWRDIVVILHKGGAHIDVARLMLWEGPRNDAAWRVLAEELRAAVDRGMTGHLLPEITKYQPEGSDEWLVKVEIKPAEG